MALPHEDNDNKTCVTHEKTHKTNWLPWLLVGGMAVLLAFKYLDLAGTTGTSASGFNWLTLAFAAICPLMMMFMMFGHGNHSNNGGAQNQDGHSGQGCCGGHQAHNVPKNS